MQAHAQGLSHISSRRDVWWPGRSVRTWTCTPADVQCVAQLTGHGQAVHCVAWGAEPSSLLSGAQARLTRAALPGADTLLTCKAES